MGQQLNAMLTGTTFDAMVSNFTATLDPAISSAGIVQGYGFAVNGCAPSWSTTQV